MSSETKSEGNAIGGAAVPPEKKRASGRLFKFVAGAFVLLFVYGLGVNVGNGSVMLGGSKASGKNDLPENLNYSSVEDMYDSLKVNYDGKLTNTQLIDGLKHGLATATNDPYTEYFTAKEAKQFTDDINSSFGGIGAELGLDAEKNVTVISPITGFPAEAAGLKSKDIIVTINDESTQGFTVNKAVDKIRGEKGTKVKLGIIRNESEPLTLEITRDTIVVPSVKTETFDGNIGYLQVSRFADDTAELTQAAAEKFKADGVKSIILDLRNNPGGYLESAIDISSLWVKKGDLIVNEKGTSGNDAHYGKGGNILSGIKTVVLVNNGSASSSEIVAGALRDNKQATLIGEKTYGKGVVQRLINFPDGSQLKVTVASWYRPNGQNIQKKGITPDQIVKITDEDAEADKDTQLDAAKAFLQ